MIPYHVEVMLVGDQLVRGFFYREGERFRAMVEHPSGEVVDLGTHDTMPAAHAACMSTATPTTHPLARWSSWNLLVCRVRRTGKWVIVAAKGKAFEFTGVEFDTEAEARRCLTQ